jgi:DNA-binding PadR family transcriptional regulator
LAKRKDFRRRTHDEPSGGSGGIIDSIKHLIVSVWAEAASGQADSLEIKNITFCDISFSDIIYLVTTHTGGLLSQTQTCILLALSLKPRHGYELMRQITEDSGGRVKLGAGVLYGNITQLREDNFIEEMPFVGGARRRYYRLTKKGWDTLQGEIEYFQSTIKLAKKRHVV